MKHKLNRQILPFLRSEAGLATVEYAIAGAIISAAAVAAFTGLGTAVANRISVMCANLKGGSC